MRTFYYFAVLSLLPLVAPLIAAAEVPPPLDVPYPGLIELSVDATNVHQRIFEVRERIPVSAGKLTLLHPEWRFGAHAPDLQKLSQFAGFTLSAGGKPLQWLRDPYNVYAFHIEVPVGVSEISAQFQFLSPTEHNQGPVVATEEMVALHWEGLLLYPAGYYMHGIKVHPSVRFPNGWKSAGALENEGDHDGESRYKALSVEELVDSPLYAGRHMKRIELDPNAKAPVFLNLFADNDEELNGSPKQIDAHRALVQQAYRLFGSHHYDHYDFLLAISDEFSFAGIEHQQSGENGVRSNYFSDWDHQQNWRSGLISHEYTHSWDGKFLRPKGQAVANFNEPMDDTLMWVYEGGTSYWGQVLAARSGLTEVSQMRDALAATGALYDHRIGRRWRALADTAHEPIITRRTPQAWQSWQRSEDYYAEGELIWFDADTKIRELSQDRKSLDDFARLFFGQRSGEHLPPLPYTFEDVVRDLNRVQPYDWAGFLRARLDGHGPGAPLEGFERAGWQLVYGEEPTPFSRDADSYRHATDFSYSLGLTINDEGRVVGVLWDSPAFKAGLTTGYIVLAVNGRAYKPELLLSAVTAAKNTTVPIEVLVRKEDRFLTVRFDYHEGLKYPQLKRLAGSKDRLELIFKPRT